MAADALLLRERGLWLSSDGEVDLVGVEERTIIADADLYPGIGERLGEDLPAELLQGPSFRGVLVALFGWLDLETSSS